MKKCLKVTSLILVMTIFASLLSSCLPVSLENLTGAVLATTLEAQAEARREALGSYTANSEMALKCIVSGTTINYTAEMRETKSGAGTAEAQYHTKYVYKTELKNGSSNRVYRSTMEHGLSGGEGFMRTSVEGTDVLRVKSPLTENQYFEFLSYGAKSGSRALCKTSSAKRRADGGWSISFSGFSLSSLAALATQYGITQFTTKVTITDAVYSFELAPDMMYESARLELSFDDSNFSFSIETKYSDIGATECKIPPISHYDNVSDMRLATKLRTDFQGYIDEKDGKFNFVLDTMKDDTVLGGFDRSGTFGWTDDGKFFFRAKMVDGFYEEYADGVVTETQGRTEEISESSAVLYISTLLNPLGFTELMVDTFRADGNVIYFDVVMPDGFFYNLTGGKYSSSDKIATMAVTYRDGKLREIVLTANGSGGGYFNTVNKLRLTITYGK